MEKQNTDKTISSFSVDEAQKEKKKFDSHLVNLEFKKEQLLILIEKLYKISGERVNLISKEKEQNGLSKHINNAGSYLFSIAEQLKQAQNNRKEIEEEISKAKKHIEQLDNTIRNRKQG